MQTLDVGVIIADDNEYAPISGMAGEPCPFFARDGHKFTLTGKGGAIRVHSVCCGIGKVNAAAAAMYLCDNGCTVILNAGLSGGISGVARGDIVIGTSYTEHDFDLSSIGYKKGEKPSQKYVYEADSFLEKHFASLYPDAITGALVTGDCFVCDPEVRNDLKNRCGAAACDMETAAIASVCYMTGAHFLSLRRISDNAGADAETHYRQMNNNEKFDLAVMLFEGIKNLPVCEKLF